MLIRPATTSDARGIARVQLRGWQVGFRGIVPAAYLGSLSVDALTNRWLGHQAEFNRLDTVVAENEDETIIGWAAYGPNQSDLPPEVGQLGALFVDPDYWDQGIGGALLTEAERRLAEAGYQRAILWTLAEHTRTRRFYDNRGWSFDGAREHHPSGPEVVRYARNLSHVDPSTANE